MAASASVVLAAAAAALAAVAQAPAELVGAGERRLGGVDLAVKAAEVQPQGVRPVILVRCRLLIS